MDNKTAESQPPPTDTAEPANKRQRLDEKPIQPKDKLANLPEELQGVDFTRHITWKKYAPYPASSSPSSPSSSLPKSDSNVAPPIPTTPVNTPPVFVKSSPALCHHVNAISGRARACTIHLKPQKGQTKALPRPVPTPIFMPVGTKGCLKALTVEELMTDPALSCPIILANTYHMALQPGTELVDEFDGLHCFMGQNKHSDTTNDNDGMTYNLLTDSGGFQMVSLAKLSQVTEEGVTFENPFLKGDHCKRDLEPQQDAVGADDSDAMMLLKPEDSIRFQNEIGANIIMALDDVVSSVEVDDDRFEMPTYRTLRWYDRCIQAHAKEDSQNLFPIVQGGLDTDVGGLRERCLAGFRRREVDLGYIVPGYAIGGLAGGESKDEFWRVVDQCCRALPDSKPRYLMGVGYPLDLVVCTALGVDMYDCVYPTRTARFGVALVPGEAPGTMRLKSHEFATDVSVVQEGCGCQACHPKTAVSRSRLHRLLKTDNPLAIQLLTQHNIAYMMSLVRNMRQAILDDAFAAFAQGFMADHFRGESKGGKEIPGWVHDALASAGINL